MNNDYLKKKKPGRKPKNYVEPLEIKTNFSANKMKSSNKKVKKKYAKAGRPRTNYDFHTARMLIRNECFDSKVQYYKWWEANKPAKIPKRPDRAYNKDFISWNDFLGNNNTFPHKRVAYRRFADAKSFIRSLNFKNQNEFFDYIRSDKSPNDIPRRPDIVYRETRYDDESEMDVWFSWDDWLGKSTLSKLQERKDKIEYLLICKPKNENFPQNIFMIISIVCKDSSLKDMIINHKLNPIKCYVTNQEFDHKAFIKNKYQIYKGEKYHYNIFNINELYYVFDMNMDIIPLNQIVSPYF